MRPYHIPTHFQSAMDNNFSSSSTGWSSQQPQVFPSYHLKHNITSFSDTTSTQQQPTPTLNFSSSLAHHHHLIATSGAQFSQILHPLAAAESMKLSLAKGVAANVTGSAEPFPKEKGGGPSKGGASAGRKRNSNRERHSKICTAQGIRDRRMRLSVDVAHKFFGLQDMLGYDKASETISWLLDKSKKAIRQLNRKNTSPVAVACGSDSTRGVARSTSDSGDSSGMDETTMDTNHQLENGLKDHNSQLTAAGLKKVMAAAVAPINPVGRESRVIARAKARAMEKMRRRFEKPKQVIVSPLDQNQAMPLSPMRSAEESGSRVSTHDRRSLDLGMEINEGEASNLGTSMLDCDQHHMHVEGSSQLGLGVARGSNLVAFNNNSDSMMDFFSDNWVMGGARTRSGASSDMSNFPTLTDIIWRHDFSTLLKPN